MRKTKPKPKQNALASKSGANRHSTAIVKVAPAPERPWELNTEQVTILKNSIAKGATDEELKFCLTVARRYKLDPFKQQIWFIKRWDESADNGKGGLGAYIWTPQVGIYGMAHIAARDHKDYGSFSVPEYGPIIEVDVEGKKIKGPQWCRVGARKKGASEPSVGEAFFEEYCPKRYKNTLFWRSMPHRMISKCAKAQAIREAYPETGGLYIPEESARFNEGYTPSGRQITYEETQIETREEIAERVIREKKAAIEQAKQTPGTAAYAQAHKEPEQAVNSKPKEIPLEKKQEAMPAAQTKKIAFVKTMPDHDVAVSGYVADEKMQQFLADVAAVRFKSQKDAGIYWRFAPAYLEGFKKLCGQLSIEVA